MKTTTQPKKRGRPVGSKKAISEKGAILVPGSYKKFEQMVKRAVKEEVAEQERFKAPEELPDSEATAEQVRNAGKWLGLEEPTNHWKYACIAILLGLVTAMILSTPTIISLFDACVQ